MGLLEGITEIELSIVELNDKSGVGILEGIADDCSMFELSEGGIVNELIITVLLHFLNNKHIDLYDISIELEELTCTLLKHNNTNRQAIASCKQLIHLLEAINNSERIGLSN